MNKLDRKLGSKIFANNEILISLLYDLFVNINLTFDNKVTLRKFCLFYGYDSLPQECLGHYYHKDKEIFVKVFSLHFGCDLFNSIIKVLCHEIAHAVNIQIDRTFGHGKQFNRRNEEVCGIMQSIIEQYPIKEELLNDLENLK